MSRPLLLDLFCGAGGAAMGYHRAGFDVVGVDIEPQPNYPFEFHQMDALAMRQDVLDGCWHEGVGSSLPGMSTVCLGHFAAVHASPPCQHFAASTRDRDRHPDLIAPVRGILQSSGLPYIIENVERAPLLGYLRLCGSMFGLQIQRHRYFELSFPAWSPGGCNHKAWDGRPWSVIGKLDGKDWKYDHSWKPSLERAKQLMDMPWVETDHEIAEAVPPAYTEWIGTELLAHLEAEVSA